MEKPDRISPEEFKTQFGSRSSFFINFKDIFLRNFDVDWTTLNGFGPLYFIVNFPYGTKQSSSIDIVANHLTYSLE